MNEKYLGYSMLGAGILVMLFALVQVVLAFTGQIKPYQIYTPPPKKEAPAFDLSQLQQGAAPDLSSLLTSNMDSIFPQDQLALTINLSIHFFLMSFIAGFGFKISQLGVMLVRPVYVKMKNGENADATKKPQ